MPNFSGIWSTAQQFQARGQNIWPKPPCAPTGVTGTAGNAQVSVAFTAPSCTGKYPAGVATYTATSTPGCFTASGASSPLVVTGLTNNTAYTFKVKATGSNGLTGPCSAASGSVTPINMGQQVYTTAGTYSWVAPACVTSVSVVAVGGGGAGGYTGSSPYPGGSGGGLGYRNNYSVTPGNSYTVVVGARGLGGAGSGYATNGGNSYFISTCIVAGYGGQVNGASGGSYAGTGGGNGGSGGGGFYYGSGGGAGGYSGAGGDGRSGGTSANPQAGLAGAGGGGGGGGSGTSDACGAWYASAGGGGGVGLYGQGSNGSGGAASTSGGPGGGGGSGGSSGASGYQSSGGIVYGGCGGAYGGGGGSSANTNLAGGNGGSGAVRIIWPGNTRSFPSTNVGP